MLGLGVRVSGRARVRVKVKRVLGYETPGYEKVRVRNVCKPSYTGLTSQT